MMMMMMKTRFFSDQFSSPALKAIAENRLTKNEFFRNSIRYTIGYTILFFSSSRSLNF